MARSKNGGKRAPKSVGNLTVRVLVEIRDQIAALRADTNAQFSSLRADTNAQISALRADTNAQISALRGEVSNLRGEVSALRTDLELLRTEVAAGLARHEEAIGKLVRQGAELATRFDNFLTGAHQRAHEELRHDHERLEARIDLLERQVGRP